MSQSDAETFVTELMEDEELRNRLNSEIPDDHDDETTADDVRELMARVVPDFAKERGYDFTAEEGFEALEAIKNEIQSDELSDVELEQVAGGKSANDAGQIMTSVLSVAVGCMLISLADDSVGSDEENCMFY